MEGNMAHITNKMRQKAKNSRLPSNQANATVNRAGGVAFEISDPALKLITMTGGSFYAEPRFYNGDTVVPKRAGNANGRSSVKSKFSKLATRLDIVDAKLKGFASCEELDDVAREVIATAIDVANSDNPEDLLAIARWLRNDAYIRLTPQVLLVVASRIDATKPFVRKYAKHIAVRPDEIKTCMLLHRFFFGMKSMSNSLAWGLTDTLGKFSEAAFLKYNSNSFPTWKDVLCTLPSKKGKQRMNPALAYYLISGEVSDPAAIPVVAARKELAKLTKFDARAKDLALTSKVNWEVLLSQFGKTDATAVWEHLLDNNLVGYMALLRNLRNLLEAGVKQSVIDKAVEKLADPKEVVRSKQLPFRFLMAHRVLNDHFRGTLRYGGSGRYSQKDSMRVSQMLEAIETAANLAVENVPVLPGLTAVFADNSGSMGTAVSAKSQMSCAGAANALAGIVAKRAEKAIVCAFATEVAPVTFTRHDTVIGIAEKVQQADTRGWSTDAYKIPRFLAKQGLKPDRVIILSDMQCWNSGGGWGRSSSPLCDEWASFKRSSKDTWLHSVHLNGYGDSPVDDGARVNQLAGFSEKIVSMLLQTEGGQGNAVEESIPTVEQVRKGWYLG
jgi:hypothetical protein